MKKQKVVLELHEDGSYTADYTNEIDFIVIDHITLNDHITEYLVNNNAIEFHFNQCYDQFVSILKEGVAFDDAMKKVIAKNPWLW